MHLILTCVVCTVVQMSGFCIPRGTLFPTVVHQEDTHVTAIQKSCNMHGYIYLHVSEIDGYKQMQSKSQVLLSVCKLLSFEILHAFPL